MRIDASALRKWLGVAVKKLQAQTQVALGRTAAAAATYARLSRLYKSHTYGLRGHIRPSVEPAKAFVTASAPYAWYVEHGTRPHPIVARRAKTLRFVQNGEVVFRRRVYHPGTAPRPFMAEAQQRATPLFSRLVTEAATTSFK